MNLQEPDDALDRLASDVIAACIETHRLLGPGFVEAAYENALCVELALRSIPFRRQTRITLAYKGRPIGQHIIDVIVADRLVLELKAVEALAPIHALQVRSYLAATGLTLGLVVNFNTPVLLRGVRRVVRQTTDNRQDAKQKGTGDQTGSTQVT